MHIRNRTEKGVQNATSLQDRGWHLHTSNKPSPKKFSERTTEDLGLALMTWLEVSPKRYGQQSFWPTQATESDGRYYVISDVILCY